MVQLFLLPPQRGRRPEDSNVVWSEVLDVSERYCVLNRDLDGMPVFNPE